MMHCSDANLDLYWTLATSLHTLMRELGQKCVPKNVLKKSYNSVDSVEKSLWILRLIFKFSFIFPLRTPYFAKVNDAVWNLSLLKFPMVISVASKLALYMHVVVIWRGRVIDYESRHTYPHTAETLTLICGSNTSYQTINDGFSISPSKKVCNNPNNKNIEVWGCKSYKFDGNIRKYFK
jgi:hypothetical protein